MICETQCNIGRKTGLVAWTDSRPRHPTSRPTHAGVSLRGGEPKNWSDASGLWACGRRCRVSRGHQGRMVGSWVLPALLSLVGRQRQTPWAATCDGPSLTLDMAWPEMASLVHARTDPCCGRRLACWMSAPDGPLASFGFVLARSGQAREKSGSQAQCGSREVRVNASLTKEGKAARYVGQELLVWLVMLCPTPSISRLPQTGGRACLAWADLG